ncbi:MAG TPA: M1 family metallopeptidase, partial [Gemmatimonadaceae bacterium]|nr:M1 family metallopeptidase [Gemmatimonadaceae bacterium]
MHCLLGLALLLQQPVSAGETTPASGDTTGYWQQRVAYTMVATLDESKSVIHAHGDLVYVNNSPDTLREMYVQQYLNAFRPGSKWSAADAREHVVRFQNLRDPDYGYERFTAPPTVDGTPVVVDYPGAPDSTVAHFRLPRPLPPHDSLRVAFAWDARPSTVLRRQGRRGRTYDFAQWYPKVAVYDRLGWEPNAFVPAGELYGEFGTYDVTLVVAEDQVLAATGVPVSGDPGWARVSETGPPRLAEHAYADVPPAPTVDVPAGSRAVRFYARDVHHFAWSASPDYRYAGGVYVRRASARFPTWDTVSLHVLYKPRDDTSWGGGRALDRIVRALGWLESLYGPYGYPAFTMAHRLEGGGTEFPMMIMTGGDSYGLILHETGHQYTYGILANNEWRSGWMDEGLTDYQTRWAQQLTPQDHPHDVPLVAPPLLPTGYRVNAVTIPASDSTDSFRQVLLDLWGRSQPIATTSAAFSEFGIYNEMIYNRAGVMYGQLRALMGDSVFVRFLHDYYARWAFKHVDEQAMRASAARTEGQDLGWFFDEWLHHTGLLDYRLGPVSSIASDSGRWVSHIEVDRRGAYAFPMPVGIHTSRGWSIARARPDLQRQILEVTTPDPPDSAQIDPFQVTWDWDRRDNTTTKSFFGLPAPRFTPDWPGLDQADRSHTIVAWSPRLWYAEPQGIVGGFGFRTNYLSTIDRCDFGLAVAARSPVSASGTEATFGSRFNLWVRAANMDWPGFSRPLMGYSVDAGFLDGILKVGAAKQWDLSPFLYARGPTISAKVGLTTTYPSEPLLLPEQWSDAAVTELSGTLSYQSMRTADGATTRASVDLGAGFAAPEDGTGPSRGYGRVLAMLSTVQPLGTDGSGDHTISLRVIGGE